MQQISGHILRMTDEVQSCVAFVKLSYNICDLFVNVNKNDSYYTLFPKERKVFEKINCMELGINYDEPDPAVEREWNAQFLGCGAARDDAGMVRSRWHGTA